MSKLLILFLSTIAYKLLSNFVRLKQLQRYEKEFIDFLSDKSYRIDEHKLQTIDLFKKAGVKDSQTPISQPVGYGQVANFNASVFQNFPMAQKVIAGPALEMFKNAIGIYKTRMFEAINPLYWIDLIIFLPKNLLAYIGLDSEATAFKLWNVFLTFIWWAICTVVTLFQPEIKDFITKVFTQS